MHHLALSERSNTGQAWLLSIHLPPLVGAPANQSKLSQNMDKVQFSCKLETVARKEVLVSLFQSAGNQVADGTNDEFLMHLDAQMPDQGNEKVQEAEFIIIVDRLVMLCDLVAFFPFKSILMTIGVYQEWFDAGHSLETGARSNL